MTQPRRAKRPQRVTCEIVRAPQVELVVLTNEDIPAMAHLTVRYSATDVRYILLSAVEMDALVASWQHERARVIVSDAGE